MDKNRSNMLDSIKGLMILFIIITHFRFNYPSDYQKLGFYFYIDMAVPVFIIITAYLYSSQFTKRNILLLKDCYSLELILHKVLRFIVPFAITCIVQISLMLYVNNLTIVDIITIIVRGGYGPGAYFNLIIAQNIIFIPVIYFIIRKFNFAGVVFCFLINGAWEAVQFCWGLENDIYAFITFRYSSIIAFGCFIAIGKSKLNNTVLFSMFFIGLLWQISLNYIPLNPIFMNCAWARVNYLPCLFIMPVMYVLLKKKSCKSINIPILKDLGKASYNVYLVQMTFYGCGPVLVIYKYVDNKLCQLMLCIIACLILGYLFYLIEKQLSKLLSLFVERKMYFKFEISSLIKRINSISTQ